MNSITVIRIFLVLAFFGSITINLSAQNKKFDFTKLEPVVQVFGTAYFNVENNNLNYVIGRAHLGFKYEFNDEWSAKIILDRGRPTSVGEIIVSDSSENFLNVYNTSKEGAYYSMFLKFASLQWKVNEKLRIQGGAILQNHYITQERFWGLRYVAQTFQDLYWHIPSSDLGFIAYYKFNSIFSIDAAITNGEGPRVNQDSFGDLKYAAGLDISLIKGLQTRLYYHNRQSSVNDAVYEQLFSAFAGYKFQEVFKIGGEFNYLLNVNNISDLDSYGYSVFAIYSINSELDVFARFDQLFYNQPEIFTSEKYFDGNAVKGGLSYSPINRIHLSLNYLTFLQAKSNTNQILFSMEFKL